jgi:hypothetical protein
MKTLGCWLGSLIGRVSTTYLIRLRMLIPKLSKNPLDKAKRRLNISPCMLWKTFINVATKVRRICTKDSSSTST